MENKDGDLSLRPSTMDGYIGQDRVKRNLTRYASAAKRRGDPIDHVLIVGPSGTGKTTLANIMGTVMGTEVKVISAPVIEKPYDIISPLMGMPENGILFIDEIHRLNMKVEETLYSAMEDFKLDIVTGDGDRKTAVSIKVNKFTLIGATTRLGLLGAPFRSRFPITEHLDDYTDDDMIRLCQSYLDKLGVTISPDAVQVISSRCRWTPRIAVNMCRRIRDHYDGAMITAAEVSIMMDDLLIDSNGLNQIDVAYMSMIRDTFRNGPVGLIALSSCMNESTDAIENSIEPYLLKRGFVARTSRGQILTDSGLAAIRNR